MDIHAGDILAVRGKGWLSRQILKATGNTVSHVGVVLAATKEDDPRYVFVIEALTRVRTRILAESIADAEKAYILSPIGLSPEVRQGIAIVAASFSADDYNYADIAYQLGNAVFHTTWFTDHLNYGLLDRVPICCYVALKAYVTYGLTFGRESINTLTPGDMYCFARGNPDKYLVAEIK